MWDYWICLYTQTYCTARGLRASSIAAYKTTLEQFRTFDRRHLADKPPDQVTAHDVLRYVEHLRSERGNGDSAVNRQVTILKVFYRAMTAMGYLEPGSNPMAHFPKIKASARKLPVFLSHEEVKRLLNIPPTDTILGLRDRAILTLLYGTGIRATECATLKLEDVDLQERWVRVVGKGGHERSVPLNDQVAAALETYAKALGITSPSAPFFQTRSRKSVSRALVYERVRTHARRAKIHKRISPHKLRHTFATHLMKAGVNLVTIRDLLGHRCISSTQIYLHVMANDLKEAALRHPIKDLAPLIEHLLPEMKLPMQHPPGRRLSG